MYLLAPLVLTLALSGALYKTKEVWSQVQFKAQTEGAAEKYVPTGYTQSASEAFRGRERVNVLGWDPGEMHVGAFQYGYKGQGRTLETAMTAEIRR